MNIKMKSTMLGVASAMALASGIAGAAETTFSGFTDGCFGLACVPPATPITATQAITFGGLTYNNSTFSVTTAAGFLSLGGSPGSPNVDNLGSFTLSGTPFVYNGAHMSIGVIFTAPSSVAPNNTVFSDTIIGTVFSIDNGGVFIDFDNNMKHYTFGSGPTAGQFDFWINDLSVTAGRSVAVTGSIISSIPEPDTYAMMLAGLGLMGFIARRRKQSTA